MSLPGATATFVLAFFCLAVPGHSADTPHRASPGRPLVPRVIADFENPGDSEQWHGLPCERVPATNALGHFGLRFEVPAWREGLEPRPGVRLTLKPGSSEADFSAYGKIAVDAWVEGDQPGKIGLSLRDVHGEYSWTTHIPVEPHRWNCAELSLKDAAADCDVSQVKEVVLYALRPTNSFALIVDNLRLEPPEPPPAAEFFLQRPNYRGWVFPGEQSIEVEARVAPSPGGLAPQELRVCLELAAGTHSIHRETRLKAFGSTRVVVPGKGLPPGDVRLEVALRHGNATLASRRWPLHILTQEDTASLKVYVDDANRLIVGGKPCFPLGWYGGVNEAQLAEIADSPFNCLLAYATDLEPKDRVLKLLDTMQAKGLKLVYCLNDVYPTATYLDGKDWEGVRGNNAIANAVVGAYRNHPAVLAWYLNDELPHSLLPQLEDYYHRVQQADPAHPCFIVLCNRHELPYFPETTDILGVDPYPIPKDPITRVSDFVTSAHAAVHERKPVWLVPQAFAWYQYNSKDPNRGHTPSAEELKTGRAPTYEEERCMSYLGLINGAKGLIYYCYYDLRVLPQYREMWGWMKSIASEIQSLTPALLSTEAPGTWTMSPGSTAIQANLFRCDGKLYLIAANPSETGCQIRFDLGRRIPSQVEVLFEQRQLASMDGSFEDEFKPLAVHVYAMRDSAGQAIRRSQGTSNRLASPRAAD